MKKEIIMAIAMLALSISLALSIDDYNDLIDKHNYLMSKYNSLEETYINQIFEIQDLEVSIENYQRNQTNLEKSQKESEKMLTIEIQEKDKELSDLYEEYWSYNNFTWTGCKDERTVLKFCKDCEWDLVCSGSMRPTYSCENTLYFCSASKSEIKTGDIVAFSTPEYTNEDYDTFYTIHRVIEITEKGYVTRGDNNLYIDQEINYNQIVGKLWRIDG